MDGQGPPRRAHPTKPSRLCSTSTVRSATKEDIAWNSRIETDQPRQALPELWALAGLLAVFPAGRSSRWSGRTGPARRPCCTWRSGWLRADDRHDRACSANRPAARPAQLAGVGYWPRTRPLYADCRSPDHLSLGRQLNPGWDAELAHGRVERRTWTRQQKAGKLSGGQRAQLALTLALGEATRAAGPGRAGGQPGSAGPPRVPAGPDGTVAEQARQRRAVLAPDERSGTGLRLRDRAGRLAGAGRRAGRRPAGRPITCCPARAATRPRCRPGWRSSPPATPTCRPRCSYARSARSSTRPGRSPRWAWKT